MHTRQALAKDRLNLGAWNGYQELLYKQPLALKEIQFDYFLEKDSYLVFVFNKNQNDWNGIRISNHETFPNLYFKANSKGKFVEKKGVENWRTKHSAWHHAKILFGKRSFSLFVDGHERVSYSFSQEDEYHFGFKSGQNNVMIDNVTMITQDGNAFRENFSNEKAKGLIFILVLILLSLGMRVLGTLLRGRGLNEKQTCFFLLGLQITIGMIIVILSLYDYSFQQIRYPSRKSLDEEESFFVGNERAERLKEIKSQGLEHAGKDIKKVILLGTSQTWGEGAEKEPDVIDRVIERQLNQELDGVGKYQCINAGIRGESSTGLLKLYKDEPKQCFFARGDICFKSPVVRNIICMLKTRICFRDNNFAIFRTVFKDSVLFFLRRLLGEINQSS